MRDFELREVIRAIAKHCKCPLYKVELVHAPSTIEAHFRVREKTDLIKATWKTNAPG